MCSLSGIISTRPEMVNRGRLETMLATQRHRGPHGEAIRISTHERCTAGFAHGRLAIVDPTPASAQPYLFGSGHLLLFNGEIYNYIEIRETLIHEGYHFHTSGDVEVVANAFLAYGIDCIQHFDGMFAFAIWDGENLFCARDRFGEKPLYFHQGEEELLFASTPQALFAAGVQKKYEPTVLYNFLTLGLTRLPLQPEQTFFEEIWQLPPAHILQYNIISDKVIISSYWDLNKEESIQINEENAIQQLDQLLRTSVKRRLRTDVSSGISLSGGLDSSALAVLLQQEKSNQFSGQSFSAVFKGFEKDESHRIGQVADQLQLQQHPIQPSADDFADLLEEVMQHQCEPIGSSSVLAQYMVYREARKNGIHVVFDGQGADEIFAGYTKYTPWFLQEQLQQQDWRSVNKQAEAFKQNGFLKAWGLSNRIAALAPGLTMKYLQWRAEKTKSTNPWIHPAFKEHAGDQIDIYKPIVEKLNDIQYHDLMQDGLHTLLRYADRNAMAHGIEVRLPYLSHELVEWVFRAPSTLRMHAGYTKWILRKLADSLLPKEIVWQRGKIGFETPQQQWMQHARVREMIDASRRRLIDQGILHKKILDKPVSDEGAHGKDTFDFRVLVSGMNRST